jgi:NAD(P)-dependent dehydrogenase (short-subunit alcohol dehydrogenase family)
MRAGSLAGKVAVITGASRGLGRAVALALAEEGASLALVGRDQSQLEETRNAVALCEAPVAIFSADVSVEGDVHDLEKAVLHRFGNVHILVNNAGINIRKLVHEFTLEEWNRVLATNLTGAFLMCRAFVPHMKGAGYGRILNISSIMGHVSRPARTAYSATKAALLGLTRALALELAPDGITVVGISPGPIATDMLMENADVEAQFLPHIPLRRFGRPDEVGSLARFLCSEQAGYITGTDVVIDGGWCAQ